MRFTSFMAAAATQACGDPLAGGEEEEKEVAAVEAQATGFPRRTMSAAVRMRRTGAPSAGSGEEEVPEAVAAADCA